jgi:hypothetical protein
MKKKGVVKKKMKMKRKSSITAIICMRIDNNGAAVETVERQPGGLGRHRFTGIPSDLLIAGKRTPTSGRLPISREWEHSTTLWSRTFPRLLHI